LIRPLLVALAALAMTAGCGVSGDPASARPARGVVGQRVGVDPIPTVHLFENHSSSLIAWRRARLSDRVLVHIDGHSDLDWLPDETIARLAVTGPDQLGALKLHPYAMDGTTYQRFGIWDFVYAAARLGIVREFVWVVPDGTVDTPEQADDLVRRLILGKMQMVGLDEAKSLRLSGRRISGTVLGVKLTICELSDLPSFEEPVLLDIDLDFLTTRSGTTQEVTPRPWIAPEDLVARLRASGLRCEIVTLSLSTMGGYLPPASRWVGPAMIDILKHGAAADGTQWKAHNAVGDAEAAGRPAQAEAALRHLVARYPDDASAWYALSLAEERSGHAAAAREARNKAVAADPMLVDAPLFEADVLWLNQRYAEALDAYRAYRRLRPHGPFLAYGLRREAGCLMRVDRDDEAVETFRKVVALAPDHGDTRLDLGLLLRGRGDLDGAVAELREARRILPDRADYALALGMTYARQGRLDEALAEVATAVTRRPTWAQAQLNFGVLLLEAGRPLDAAGHINVAAMLQPDDPQITGLIARLRRQGIVTTQLAERP